MAWGNKKSGYTKKRTNIFGQKKLEHFNRKHEKVGETHFRTDILGRPKQVHVDMRGSKVGETRRGTDWLGNGRAEQTDAKGGCIGYSRDETDVLGRDVQRHYEQSTGHRVGETRKGENWYGEPRQEHEGTFFKAAVSSAPTTDYPRSPSGGSDYASSSAVYSAETGRGRPWGAWVGGLLGFFFIMPTLGRAFVFSLAAYFPLTYAELANWRSPVAIPIVLGIYVAGVALCARIGFRLSAAHAPGRISYHPQEASASAKSSAAKLVRFLLWTAAIICGAYFAWPFIFGFLKFVAVIAVIILVVCIIANG